jgi:prephenate dehydratase
MPKASAVIAGKLVAEIYNLEIIKEDIDDFERNTTRFLILSKTESEENGDKCSIVFSAEHKAGTLFSVLEIFAGEDINLTRIGSIPGGQGDYIFFLDFLGSNRDDKIIKVLQDVQFITTYFRFLGCYQEKTIF